MERILIGNIVFMQQWEPIATEFELGLIRFDMVTCSYPPRHKLWSSFLWDHLSCLLFHAIVILIQLRLDTITSRNGKSMPCSVVGSIYRGSDVAAKYLRFQISLRNQSLQAGLGFAYPQLPQRRARRSSLTLDNSNYCCTPSYHQPINRPDAI